MNKLKNIENTLLLGPGPSTVSPNVYKALSTNTIGHLDPRFIDIMDQIKQMLKLAFKTSNDFCIHVSGTGSAAMESCFVNLIEELINEPLRLEDMGKNALEATGYAQLRADEASEYLLSIIKKP